MQSIARTSIANLCKTLSRRKNPPPFQPYCTAATSSINGESESDIDSVVTTDHVDDSNKPATKKDRKGKQKETLYSRINPLGNPRYNVKAVIDQWVKDGNQVRFYDLKSITRDLRKRSRFPQALQVSEWTKDNQAVTLPPAHHAVHIDLLGKVRGYLDAETYFNSLSEEDKTEKTYGALLHCYVRQRDTDKALSHWQTMKEKGLKLSPIAYNDIMSLYTHTGKYEMVPDVLSEMKENGVSPDSMTYNICLNSYGQRSDIAGMEMLLDEMERQPDVSVDWNTCALVVTLYSKAGLTAKAKDFLKVAEERLPVGNADGYRHLMSLHATLGNKSEVLRLWCLLKNTCKKPINRHYIDILNNLMRLDALEEAEKILEEWESSGNFYDHRIQFIFINKYIDKEQYVKAEAMMKDLVEKGKSPNSDKWGRVAAGYLDLGNNTKAVECMKIALSSGRDSKWKPDHGLMTRLLDVLGVEVHTSDIDKLVDTFMTHASEEKTDKSSITKKKTKSGKQKGIVEIES